jgi:RNA polymerase sigma factor (TIGR02999 family)
VDVVSVAPDRLLPLVYPHLRKLASGYLRGRNQSLQPTALVHEAFLRLAGKDAAQFKDRDHFIAVAATAMRQILIDHARRKMAAKRGGGAAVTLDSSALYGDESESKAVDVLAIDRVLARLYELSPRQARIVELQFFGGLTLEETARVMEISLSLVEKEWRRARAWMHRELAREQG